MAQQLAFNEATRASHEFAGRLGPFRLLEQLGEGGMAVVYRARRETQTGITRDVVLKAMLPQLVRNTTLVQMFEAEARLTAQLRHPNIVCVEDFGVDNETPYLIMEFLDGKNLSQLRGALKKARRTMPVGVAVAIARDLCRALGYAHDFVALDGQRMQVIHRDVSPSNVMLQRDGSVKLLDFGVAKLSSIAGQAVTTSLKGKFAYMSPEQVDQKPIDRRCDVFAAGIVLHEMLTNERLFGTRDERETLRRVSAARALPPSARNRAVGAALDAVVMRALAREREDRFDSGREMAAALEELGLAASRRELAEFLEDATPEDRSTARQMAAVHPGSEPFNDGETDQDAGMPITAPGGNTASAAKLLLLSNEDPTPFGEHTAPSIVYSGEIEVLEGSSSSGLVDSLANIAVLDADLVEEIEDGSEPHSIGEPLGASQPTRKRRAINLSGPNPFDELPETEIFRREAPAKLASTVTPALLQAVLEPVSISEPVGIAPIGDSLAAPVATDVTAEPTAAKAASAPTGARSYRWLVLSLGVVFGIAAVIVTVRVVQKRRALRAQVGVAAPAVAATRVDKPVITDAKAEAKAEPKAPTVEVSAAGEAKPELKPVASRRETELAAPIPAEPKLPALTATADPEAPAPSGAKEATRETKDLGEAVAPSARPSSSSSHSHSSSQSSHGHHSGGSSRPASTGDPSTVRDGRIVNPFDS